VGGLGQAKSQGLEGTILNLSACIAGKEIEDQVTQEFSNQGLPQSQLLGFELG